MSQKHSSSTSQSTWRLPLRKQSWIRHQDTTAILENLYGQFAQRFLNMANPMFQDGTHALPGPHARFHNYRNEHRRLHNHKPYMNNPSPQNTTKSRVPISQTTSYCTFNVSRPSRGRTFENSFTDFAELKWRDWYNTCNYNSSRDMW